MNVRFEPARSPADQMANLATRSCTADDLRERIERAIESLLALLDTIDGDADLEPSLGAPERAPPECRRYLADIITDTTQEAWAAGAADDQELPSEWGSG